MKLMAARGIQGGRMFTMFTLGHGLSEFRPKSRTHFARAHEAAIGGAFSSALSVGVGMIAHRQVYAEMGPVGQDFLARVQVSALRSDSANMRAPTSSPWLMAVLPPFHRLAVMPSIAYIDGMTSPQLSVRSKRARDLAHRLSRREGRPIHAIVEEALSDYARRHPGESAAAFLRRMRKAAPVDDQAFAELDAAIAEHRHPHQGIEL